MRGILGPQPVAYRPAALVISRALIVALIVSLFPLLRAEAAGAAPTDLVHTPPPGWSTGAGNPGLSPTWEGALFSAAGAAVGGAIGDAVSRMIGVHTMRQLFRFAPRTWGAFWRQGVNMQALEGSAVVGGIWSSGVAVLGEPRAK